jgi:cell wall assembly regulator SMI1
MHCEDLAWENCRAELSDKRIGAVEAVLGVRLPEDYTKCIKKHHGGTPKPSRFTFRDQKLGEMESCLGMLLSLDENDSENLVDTWRDLASQLPRTIVPFADDGGGDFICFDYRNLHQKTAPVVVYWHHERTQPESLTGLCDSFSDFIKMLY